MGYQALLFCPDEKTARTVTQVLSELDFEVVPCTEPFAAVKKLMAEHFDAVVVDCDNEQNATLLFKSARNAPGNQSALAVAVVEGQAGVAKAFRIGANLVLTKPINVEQAKGTLRVARGLLRKNESAKSATSATNAPLKPAASAPAAAKPTLVPSSAVPRVVAAVSPVAASSAPAQKPAPQPSFAASASSVIVESGESAESVSAAPPQPIAPKALPTAVSQPKPETISIKTETSLPPSTRTSAATSGAASAAAPAREASVVVPDKPLTVIPEPETPVENAPVGEVSSAVEEPAAPAPTFTFGGTVGSEGEPAKSGSKKALVAVAAVVLIAAGGYVAWTQFSRPSGAGNTSPAVTARPVTTSVVPQAAPGAAAIAPESAPTPAAIPDAAVVAQPSASVKPAPVQTSPGASNAQAHASKVSPEAESPKHAAAVVAENEAPTAAVPQPIVVKKSNAATLGKSPVSVDAPAPSIAAIASAGDGGTLPNLLGNQSSSPAPVLQVMNVSQGVSQGLVIKKTSPAYPANALRMRVEGSVQLLATISKSGNISAVKILSGEPTLARAAADAVKQWKYKPYLLDGSPVEIQTQVTVNFKLPK